MDPLSVVGAIERWVATACRTYVLHSEHGNGYLWWSGPGSDLGMATACVIYLRKHNCYEHGCPRIGRLLGDDGHKRCKRCHRRTHSDYPQGRSGRS